MSTAAPGMAAWGEVEVIDGCCAETIVGTAIKAQSTNPVIEKKRAETVIGTYSGMKTRGVMVFALEIVENDSSITNLGSQHPSPTHLWEIATVDYLSV
ncbi:hypothetical protein [Symmachiella macrocystis]|uniref:hypothetical protein n=1 Tax=Symmachiella macrocystis TaxID=2527985 RepID=UPI0011B5B2DA|nr:hypothetical protein [Symmachiella macrocystis]